jgi:predicted nucleotidyltransferase
MRTKRLDFMSITSNISNPDIVAILEDCKRILASHYKDKLISVVLFGSASRQQLTLDSDLDLLVVLKPPINYFDELRTLTDLLYPLQLEASHWISAKPVALPDFEGGTTQLYRNIQKEGIVL